MAKIPKAVFTRVGDLIKLTFTSGNNKEAVLEFDGDTLETKVNSVSVSRSTSSGLSSDIISESTSNSGVTVEGVLLKDSAVVVDTINESTSAAGVTIDGVLLKDSEVSTDTINESTTGAGVTIEGVTLKDSGIQLSPNVAQYVEEVLIPSGQIVGTDAGDLGHADGVPLVAAPGAGYALELVSSTLIYDFATAAYTGGAGDDLVVRIGTTSVSPAVATTDLLTAAGDQVVHLRALAAADYDLPVNTGINLKSTEVTNPGLPEIFTLEVTAAEDTGGDVVVSLDGVDHNITITADTAEVNAGEIQTYIHNLTGYTATILGAVVTVTAATDGAQTDATFAQGTANSSAATVTVTQQGVDPAEGVIRAHVIYNVHTTGL